VICEGLGGRAEYAITPGIDAPALWSFAYWRS
jgi:hypothetical protein